jgi:hypothetical protein
MHHGRCMPLRFRGGVEIAAQGMLSLRVRDPLMRDAMHAHACAGSAGLLVP